MEWPYDHPRRGDMPAKFHALSLNEYNVRKPPYATKDSPQEKVFSYVQGWTGSDYSTSLVVNEKDHPYTGTNYAWVRARCLGGKTNIWGRLALRLSDYDFKGKTHDGYGEDWPISYADIEPYYDKVDLLLGISGVKENLKHLPDGKFQRPYKLNAAEVTLRNALQKMGRTATPYRAGVTTDGLIHNKYRSKCYGRGACSRRAGGCDIHAAFDSPTGLIYPARDTGRLTIRTNATAHEVQVDPATGKAGGVGFIDTVTGKSYAAKAKAVVLAASTLESTRLLLLSKSPQHPNGIANSSGVVGHYFCEHLMGPTRHRPREGSRRRAANARRWPARRLLRAAIPQPRGQAEPISFAATASKAAAARACCRATPQSAPGFGKAWKKHVRDYAGAYIDMGGFGEVLPRYENSVSIDPVVKDRWGIPVLRFDYKLRRQREEDGRGHGGRPPRRCSRRRASRSSTSADRLLTEGWSIHELGTSRMGSDPKTSALNQFQQSHDVKNLFVVDGSSHVNASCQNPTWTIMALAWRSCEYLADSSRRESSDGVAILWRRGSQRGPDGAIC